MARSHCTEPGPGTGMGMGSIVHIAVEQGLEPEILCVQEPFQAWKNWFKTHSDFPVPVPCPSAV